MELVKNPRRQEPSLPSASLSPRQKYSIPGTPGSGRSISGNCIRIAGRRTGSSSSFKRRVATKGTKNTEAYVHLCLLWLIPSVDVEQGLESGELTKEGKFHDACG